jgi:hypothetical protein
MHFCSWTAVGRLPAAPFSVKEGGGWTARAGSFFLLLSMNKLLLLGQI